MNDKVKINSKYNSFCSLCSRRIRENEECYSYQRGKFLIHLDCSLAKEEGRITNMEFRRNAKNRPPAQKRGRGGEKHPAKLVKNRLDKR